MFLEMRYRARQRRRGAGTDAIHRNRLRYSGTFNVLMRLGRAEEKARAIVFDRLSQRNDLLVMKQKFDACFASIRYMQLRVKAQLSVKFSKVEVLTLAWERLLSKISQQAVRRPRKDILASKLLTKFFMIPSRVRAACLKHWVKKCRELYAIAYLQWRYLHAPDSYYRSERELEELIQSRLAYLNNNYQPECKEASLDTREEARLSQDFLTAYGIADKELQPFKVNSFYQIGLEDPFPFDHEDYKGAIKDEQPALFPYMAEPESMEVDDLVYP